MSSDAAKDPEPKKGLTAMDRLKAIDIAKVDMYLFNQKHKLTNDLMSSERFMVIRGKNGRKYVFREVVDTSQKRILT